MVVFVAVQWGHRHVWNLRFVTLQRFFLPFWILKLFFPNLRGMFFPWEPENMGGNTKAKHEVFWSIADIWVHWWFDTFTSNLPGPDLFRSILEAWNQPPQKKRYLHFFLKCQTNHLRLVFLKNKLASMMRLLQLHWLSTVAYMTAASDVNDLLQIRTGAVVNYSSPKALKELAEVLVLAKKECLGSSVDCISTLKQVGIFGWLGGGGGGWERGNRKKRVWQMMQRIQSTKEDTVMSFLDDYTSQTKGNRLSGWDGYVLENRYSLFNPKEGSPFLFLPKFHNMVTVFFLTTLFWLLLFFG